LVITIKKKLEIKKIIKKFEFKLRVLHKQLEQVNEQKLDQVDVIHLYFALHYFHNQDKQVQQLFLVEEK